jgi:hypothetical protein
VIDTLKVAFVQGRLTKDELVARAGQAFVSRTYAELAALTADIPAGTTGVQPLRMPARARARPPVKVVVACAGGIIVPAMLVVAGFLTNTEPHLVFKRVMVFTLIGWLAVAVKRDVRRRKRSREQLPPQPGQRGQALGGGQGGRTGDDLIPCEVTGDVRARHVPGHRAIQRSWRSLTVRRDQRRPAQLQGTA